MRDKTAFFYKFVPMIPQRNMNWWSAMPPATKNLILINVIIWLVEVIIPRFGNQLLNHTALHFCGSDLFNPIQLVTYMFLHDPDSIWHILFNMFTLWMFGRILEQTWGTRRFLIFYLVCGVGAAITQEVVWQLCWLHDYASAIAPQNGLTVAHMQEVIRDAMASGDTAFLHAAAQYKAMLLTVGASGAIFGLLLGFAFTFPDMPLYLFFIPIPIKAKYMVLGYGILEFFLGISGAQSTVAHFAHLGGLIFGFLLIMWWRYSGRLIPLLRVGKTGSRKNSGGRRMRADFDLGSIDTRKLEDRRRLNELLDKIRLSGYASLSKEERDELRTLSERIK